MAPRRELGLACVQRIAREAVDLGAHVAGGLGIGLGDAARIDVAVIRIKHGGAIVRRLDERIARPHFVEIDEVQAHLEMLRLGVLRLKEF